MVRRTLIPEGMDDLILENNNNKQNLLYARYEKLRRRAAAELFGGTDPGTIVKSAGAGDMHHSDCVQRIETASGAVLYYKPRDCRCSDLLGEINRLLFGHPMTPEQVCGEGYAFQKAVGRMLPAGRQEREDFYTMMGKLTAVFYALGSTDMHAENVIPSGAVPFVVDTETLLCPLVYGFGGAGDFSRDYADVFPELGMSVGESMVLPRFYAKIQKSPLMIDGSPISGECEKKFEQGFKEGCRAVMRHGAQICAILDRYAGIPIRFLTRSTAGYYRLIILYKNARNDEERETILKRLEKGLNSSDLKRWSGIIGCERKSIANGDIPCFCIRAGETCLRSGSGDIAAEGFAALSPIQNAKQRIARMNEKDLAMQCSYLSAAILHTDAWIGAPTVKSGDGGQPLSARAAGLETVQPLSAEAAMSEAIQALHLLDEEKIPADGGRIFWHAPLITGKAPSLYGLAEGFSGTAYFCQALSASALAGDREKRLAAELAKGCFADMKAFGTYLIEHYRTPATERDISRRFEGGFGFADGLAGYLWVLTHFAGLYPETVQRIMAGLERFQIADTFQSEMQCFFQTDVSAEYGNDTLSDGAARCAAADLVRYSGGDEGALREAGIILSGIRQHRLQNGSYTLFHKNRRQYFLPSFLRGSLGIAHIMLRYAELLCGYQTGGREWMKIK